MTYHRLLMASNGRSPPDQNQSIWRVAFRTSDHYRWGPVGLGVAGASARTLGIGTKHSKSLLLSLASLMAGEAMLVHV